ncbi:GAF domain-containing protein [Herbiconiux sp. 11R-BC]|uniref:GAF domain-containing protein n=1 Tax=Herbiconiux sp. 11R-BC TaxID=3111637 RepID=UPI003BFF0DEF
MADSDPLSFPDGPRSELDRALRELVERAGDVMTTQGRLRALLRATQVVAEELDLPVVLQRIVDAAVELVDAEYGAIGVIAPQGGGLEEFIYVGMTPQQKDTIGELPEGHGLLGALIADPHPIRLTHLSADGRSSGFPAGHPEMDSFLGVPIRVRDTVFGNLYLTNQRGGAFSAEDEQLVSALAATAGSAVENARLFAEARMRESWMTASAEISSVILSAGRDAGLEALTAQVLRLAGAGRVAVVLPTPDPELLQVAASAEQAGREGASGAGATGSSADGDGELRASGTAAAEVLAHGVSRAAGPVLFGRHAAAIGDEHGHGQSTPPRRTHQQPDTDQPADASPHPATSPQPGAAHRHALPGEAVSAPDDEQMAFAAEAPEPMALHDDRRSGPLLAVPLSASGTTWGVIVIARAPGARQFTAAEQEIADDLAGRAGLAFEVAQAREDHQRMLLVEDRSRISRDLHDHVVQQLFGTGMQLQALVRRLGAGEEPDTEAAADTISTAVTQIDDSIAQIRTVIFALESSGSEEQPTTRRRLLDLTDQASAALVRRPAVSFTGPVDLVVTGGLADDVAAVVRECVTNVVKHASATRVSLDVTAADGRVVVTVADDGIGLLPAGENGGRRSGLRNLEQRAVRREGSLTVDSAPGRTSVRWSVPFPEFDDEESR